VDNQVVRKHEIYITIIIIIIVIRNIANLNRINLCSPHSNDCFILFGRPTASMLPLGHGRQDADSHCRVRPDLLNDCPDLLQARIEQQK
jgi:hypothetical protein